MISFKPGFGELPFLGGKQWKCVRKRKKEVGKDRCVAGVKVLANCVFFRRIGEKSPKFRILLNFLWRS